MAAPVGGGGFFTAKEFEVAAILESLSELVAESDYRRIPEELQWGARRRRSGFPNDTPPPPPPPPFTIPSLCEGGKKDAVAHAGHTSSPATSLSFPTSGGEEPDQPPPLPPRYPAAKPLKNTYRHKEWVKKQKEAAASLSDANADLRRQTEESRSRFETARATNSFLLEQRSKLELLLGQRLQQAFSVRPDPALSVGPTPPPSPAAHRDASLHRRRELHPNATPKEEEIPAAVRDWEQRSAIRAAMSAEARKLRLAKQREKNADLAARSLKGGSKAYKLPRLA